MDYTDGLQTASLPLGLAFGLATDDKVLDNYGKLTEYEKEQLLAKSKGVKRKEEMQQIIQRVSDGDLMV